MIFIEPALPVAAAMSLRVASHLPGLPSAVPGWTGGWTGLYRAEPGGDTAGSTSPSPPSSTDPAPLSIPFIDSFTDRSSQKGAHGSRRPRGSRETGLRRWGRRRRPFASRGRDPPPARPPASSTGTSTARTLGYKATLPNTHRGAPPPRGAPAPSGERRGAPRRGGDPPGSGAERGAGRASASKGGDRTGLGGDRTGARRGWHRARRGPHRGAAGRERGEAGSDQGAEGTHWEPRERRDRTEERQGPAGN